ncbi:GNAT family acetyltransferase [Leisingera sp. ANG-M1]|uniref:GNAT family N-acetyltransferase n=1 Tax=Leisingera sp. ANG-M1 TaxID=1577895 RepID=UPI00057FEFE5|nr:N-acetyltransferase [Leisingera sp. ANG-M1]KIC12241.1 GNAT family acetyltransferase [Leisingera sp. ANG-M1]
MVAGPDTLNEVKEEYFDEVEALLLAAFPTGAEALLVRKLRADGDMLYECRKSWDGKIGGYFALSRMQAPEGWACLAPMAVRPEWQNGGLADSMPKRNAGGVEVQPHRPSFRFGTRMLQELECLYELPSEKIRERLPETIVVLGKPSFYGRYGFSLERAQKLKSPYPLKYTLILRHGDDVPEAELIYPRAFSGSG